MNPRRRRARAVSWYSNSRRFIARAFEDVRGLVFGRLIGWSVLVLGSVLVLSCGGETSQPHLGSTSPDRFPIPREIVLSVAPYASIEEALTAQKGTDWIGDKDRERAITLAYAAQELRGHLALIGVDAAIAKPEERSGKASFVLSVQERLAPPPDLPGARLDYAPFNGQRYSITPRDGDVFITAGDRIGVLYGVYRLLEHLGFAWYDPSETHLPERSISGQPVEWRQIEETPRSKLRGFSIYGPQVISDEFAVWMARNRLNVGGNARPGLMRMLGILGWEGDHELLQQEFSRPGLFEQHPEWYALIDGRRRPVVASGNYFNPSFANAEAANYFADRMIERLSNGDLQAVDILNLWPADDRFNRFDQSPEAVALGNETDNLLHFSLVVSRRLRAAYESGLLKRQVIVAGISYYLTMRPPTNRTVTSQLESADYLHIFYLNERSWSDYVDAHLADRDANRKIVSDLAAWNAAASLNYGVVEYYNYSIYAAVGLSDFLYLEHNYGTLATGRGSLWGYMHPLRGNPGPRRLTNQLLARLAWQPLKTESVPADADGTGERIVQEYFQRRYAEHAEEWSAIYSLMSQSVDNAREMFGQNSLFLVLLQEQIWSHPYYGRSEAAAFIPLYRAGGTQDLPAAFSGMSRDRERFRGLDDSIRLQEGAEARWRTVLAGTLAPEVRSRMESDASWFMATASRYRLMAATCDYVVAREKGENLQEPLDRMAREIAFLESTDVTRDTISPVDQRAFLAFHKALAGIP